MNLSYRSDDLPGIGGQIKLRPEDFRVEEQPLYQPTGTGEHLMLCIEKKQRSTSDAVRFLSRAFRVSPSDIGYAGLKDKQAVTRQNFTIRLPGTSQDKTLLDKFQHSHFKILWADRHENKLKRGHLAGNRFDIKIRNADPTGMLQAKRVLDRLAEVGVPNFIGEQRFGYRLINHKVGRFLLLSKWQEALDLILGHPQESDHPPTRSAREAYQRGDYVSALELLPRHLHHDRQALDALRQGKSPRDAVGTINRQQRCFFISALQSSIFNRVLNRRLNDPSSPGIDCLIDGDLAWRHDNRSVFSVDRATAECENAAGARMQSFEISPSGPMWGTGMIQAGGVVGEWEQQALLDEDLVESDLLDGHRSHATGARRPLRVALRDPDISGGADEHGPFIRVAFGLPRGSFATVVLREMMKPEASQIKILNDDHKTPIVG